MNNRLYLRELQIILQYKDRRSVKKWCNHNKVRIYSDKGTNRYFVSRSEFEIIFNRFFIPITNKNTKVTNNKENLETSFLSILLNS
jgi:hypothetical protein